MANAFQEAMSGPGLNRIWGQVGPALKRGEIALALGVICILVVVNFVVITKGSGRIAEVSARFSLDAMPGKQMAIDADLSAGLIDEAEARLRRKTLEAVSYTHLTLPTSDL